MFPRGSFSCMQVEEVSLWPQARPKWTEKTIEAVGDLAGNPLDPRKTRSQFHGAYFANELRLDDNYYMMVGYNPKSYYESSHDPIWKTTMQEEFNSLQENETWELVPLPPKRKLVQCKWVYRNKFADDGSEIKYNAILVSKLFSQFQGLYYTDTFSPVAKMESIRLVLAIVASKSWEVHHMDVKSAIIHGELQE